MKDTSAIFFFDYSEIGSYYGKEVFEAIYEVLQHSNGICAFNDGDLFGGDTARQLIQMANRVEPTNIPGPNSNLLVDLPTPSIYSCYAVGMWTDHYENFEKLNNFLKNKPLNGYLGFITFEGVIDRNSFDGFLRMKLSLPDNIIIVNGEVIPETSKYGIGNKLTKNDYALLEAAGSGHLHDAKRALKEGADVNCTHPGERGDCPIMRAARNNHVEIVLLLLKEGANPNSANEINSVLMLAVMHTNIAMVQALLEGDADVNLSDPDGCTVLDLAEYELESSNSLEEQNIFRTIINLLKKYGAVNGTLKKSQSKSYDLDLEGIGEEMLKSLSVIAETAANYLETFLQCGDESALDLSVKFATEAFEKGEYYSPETAQRSNLLGRTLYVRFKARGSLQDLQKAVALFEYAAQNLDPKRHDVPAYVNNLAIALLDRYSILGNNDDLRRGVDFQRMAAKATLFGTELFSLCHNNLSNALRILYTVDSDNKYLDEAAKVAEKAVRGAPKDSNNLPVYLGALGNSLLERYRHLGSIIGLEGAIQYLREAIIILPESSPKLSNLYLLIGESLIFLDEEYKDEKAHNEGLSYLEKATRSGLEIRPSVGLLGGRQWMMICFLKGEWDKVVEIYKLIEATITKLIDQQIYRDQIETWLRDIQGLGTYAAYALANLDRANEAVVILEQSSARLLNRALDLKNIDLQLLRETDKGDLSSEYFKVINDIYQLDKQPRQTVANSNIREKVYSELNSLVGKIRKLLGFENFLSKPTFNTIASATKLSTFLYLGSTIAGGFAIVVHQAKEDDQVSAKTIWLPKLTTESLNETLNGVTFEGTKRTGYLKAYSDWRRNSKRSAAFEWYDSIDKTSQWMWEVAMKEVCESIPVKNSITLIPIGNLAYLPWHAASPYSFNSPVPQKYALDLLPIRYSPNASSIISANRIIQRIQSNQMLAIEYSPDENPLEYAKFEIQALSSAFHSIKVLNGSVATVESSLKEIPKHEVLHFACHGMVDFNTPLNSGLLLANKQLLTLEKFLKIRSKGIRLAVLSACETGLIGADLPDEFVNLPVGLMHANTAGVIASLWSVEDFSTTILMIRFYKLWQDTDTPLPPDEALRKAQQWLRDTNNFQKISFLKELNLKGGEQLIQTLKKHPEKRNFSHPYYWAPFVLYGV